MTSYPLSGVRVIDLGNRASTAWCARLLGDYGAQVIGEEWMYPNDPRVAELNQSAG